MSPSRKPLMFSVVTATVLVLVASAVSSSGQDSPTQAEEAKKVEQRIQQLEQRLSQVEKNLAEILKASKQSSKIGLSELEQYQEFRKFKNKEIDGVRTKLSSRFSPYTVVAISVAGRESIEGTIKGVEDHLGEAFLTIGTTNPPGETMVKWATVTGIGIKKK